MGRIMTAIRITAAIVVPLLAICLGVLIPTAIAPTWPSVATGLRNAATALAVLSGAAWLLMIAVRRSKRTAHAVSERKRA
jgi:hypothetical protein